MSSPATLFSVPHLSHTHKALDAVSGHTPLVLFTFATPLSLISLTTPHPPLVPQPFPIRKEFLSAIGAHYLH